MCTCETLGRPTAASLPLPPPPQQVVDALRPVTDKPLDCHLMIVEPELRVADFAKVGLTGCNVSRPRA